MEQWNLNCGSCNVIKGSCNVIVGPRKREYGTVEY